jgi:hypothetical protein
LVVLNDKRTAPFFEASRRVADKIEVPYRTRNDARAIHLNRRFGIACTGSLAPSEWEPIGVPVLALHAQESSCLHVSVEMRRTGPMPSAVNDDEVVRDILPQHVCESKTLQIPASVIPSGNGVPSCQLTD